MRAVLASIGAGVAAFAVAAPLAVAVAAIPQAALVLVSSSPVTVHGLHFGSHRLVRVTFRAGTEVSVRTVRTGTTGAFTLPAPSGFTYDKCTAPLQVSAAGVAGMTGSAGFKLPPRECAPLSTP